jgi:hypothetical protein
LIKYPESLCARLLKARYYPSGDLLDTAFIQNQSQTWQGIVHGLELLKKGTTGMVKDAEGQRLRRRPNVGAVGVGYILGSSRSWPSA